MSENLSPTELKILNYLLENDIQNYNKMSKQVGIPASTIYDRIRNLKKKGIIKKMVPDLDLEKIGYMVFAALEIEVNTMREVDTLKDKYTNNPAIAGLFKMSGNYDLLALVIVKTPSELEKTINQLLKEPEVKDVHGNLAIHTYKFKQNPGQLTE